MHDHAGGIDDRAEAWFGQFLEDGFRVVQDPRDGEDVVIDLSGCVLVRSFKDGLPSRINGGPDRLEHEYPGVRLKPLFGPFVLQDLINGGQFSEQFFHGSTIA